MKKHHAHKDIVIIFASILSVLLIVELVLTYQSRHAIGLGLTPIEAFLPRPSIVFISAAKNFEIIFTAILYTLSRSMIGLFFGAVLALIMAFVTFLSPKLRFMFEPVLHAVNAFPIVGFAPVIILLFGQGSNLGIIFLSMLIAYFPIYISIQHAIDNTPEGIKDISRVLNISRGRDFVYIRLTEVRAALITSLKLAFPASVVGATIGEWLGVNNGIGQLITVSLYRFQPDIMYASLFAVVVVNLVALRFIMIMERHFLVRA